MRKVWLLLGAALVVGGAFGLVPLNDAPPGAPPAPLLALEAGFPPALLRADVPAARHVTAPGPRGSAGIDSVRLGALLVRSTRGGRVGGGPARAGSTSVSPVGSSRSPGGEARTAPVRYGPPVRGRLLRAFAPGPHPWSPGHRGVDLQASAGQEVRAAGPGVVAFAGWVGGKPVVSIDHADGVRTTYEPVEASVEAGQNVGGGQVIGVLAAGHRAAIDGGDGLHWGARIGRRYLDPLRLLFPPIVLKPAQ